MEYNFSHLTVEYRNTPGVECFQSITALPNFSNFLNEVRYLVRWLTTFGPANNVSGRSSDWQI